MGQDIRLTSGFSLPADASRANTEAPVRAGAIPLGSAKPAVHRATAERRCGEWLVHVEGVAGPARFVAGDLEEVERAVRRLVWSYTGRHDLPVDLDIRLPGAVTDHLWLIAQYWQDMEVEMREAFDQLRDLALSAPDIWRVLHMVRDGRAPDAGQPIGCRVSPGEPSEAS